MSCDSIGEEHCTYKTFACILQDTGIARGDVQVENRVALHPIPNKADGIAFAIWNLHTCGGRGNFGCF
jgi:hypothetical protein